MVLRLPTTTRRFRKLQGFEDEWRLRIGEWRVPFSRLMTSVDAFTFSVSCPVGERISDSGRRITTTAVDHFAMSPLLAGRERELGLLREQLAAALAGHGSLVLIGGEAGIGKTALAESALPGGARTRGALVLVGRCYDLTETPPYGPWLELFARYRPSDGCPPLPDAFARRGMIGAVASQAALFRQVADFLRRARRPPAGRAPPRGSPLGGPRQPRPAALPRPHGRRSCRSSLLATYRADELTRHHPLYQLLPALDREAPRRASPCGASTADAVRALVAARYALPEPDAGPARHLPARALGGQPFFIVELLRALEEERGDAAGRRMGGRSAICAGVHVPLAPAAGDRRAARSPRRERAASAGGRGGDRAGGAARRSGRPWRGQMTRRAVAAVEQGDGGASCWKRRRTARACGSSTR